MALALLVVVICMLKARRHLYASGFGRTQPPCLLLSFSSWSLQRMRGSSTKLIIKYLPLELPHAGSKLMIWI